MYIVWRASISSNSMAKEAAVLCPNWDGEEEEEKEKTSRAGCLGLSQERETVSNEHVRFSRSRHSSSTG